METHKCHFLFYAFLLYLLQVPHQPLKYYGNEEHDLNTCQSYLWRVIPHILRRNSTLGGSTVGIYDPARMVKKLDGCLNSCQCFLVTPSLFSSLGITIIIRHLPPPSFTNSARLATQMARGWRPHLDASIDRIGF